MSVPLDRLYNFLRDICNRDDLIIYQFSPPGSRKPEDLEQSSSQSQKPWLSLMTSPGLIFHDQEPLNYDLYTKEKIKHYVNSRLANERSQNEKDGILSYIYDEGNQDFQFETLEDKLKYFREYTKRGLLRFKERNLDGALSDFNRALQADSSQPLIQRGVVLYIMGNYVSIYICSTFDFSFAN